jgi:hypothetical protein
MLTKLLDSRQRERYKIFSRSSKLKRGVISVEDAEYSGHPVLKNRKSNVHKSANVRISSVPVRSILIDSLKDHLNKHWTVVKFVPSASSKGFFCVCEFQAKQKYLSFHAQHTRPGVMRVPPFASTQYGVKAKETSR